MQEKKDTLVLRTRTVPRKISDKINLSRETRKLSPLNRHLMDIEQSNMASKEEMVDTLNKYKLGKSFKPQRFSGKTTENGEELLSSFNNYCTLNNIDK